uniref:uncharacterized protein LOC117603836 isoform X2 n=1 Tax=Osmia lignaria TaxID=473952 RepID=UPI0014794128|nr:uncharacterized protein LOC117603836 isoform X2 [Osmia lignaria]
MKFLRKTGKKTKMKTGQRIVRQIVRRMFFLLSKKFWFLQKFCECIRIAENSSRFSLRVMEAMRSLQNDEDDFLPTSSIDDIVDYIQKNYRDDGDLYAQVRTALKQVCSQGFAMELLENEYHLIGPDAASMNRITCSNSPKDCSLSYTKSKIPKPHKKDRSKNICICETSHDEETGRTTSKRRRASKSAAARDLERTSSKRERNNREEDKLTEESAECTCSSTLTDEDNVSKIQENMQHALEKKDERRRKSVHRSLMGTPSMRRINNQTMGTGDTRKDRAAEIVKEMDEEDFEINNANESQNQIRSKKAIQTEKELERWIERCRRECERRKDRRPQNH